MPERVRGEPIQILIKLQACPPAEPVGALRPLRPRVSDASRRWRGRSEASDARAIIVGRRWQPPLDDVALPIESVAVYIEDHLVV